MFSYPELSKVSLKESVSGFTAADCQATSQTIKGKTISRDSTNSVKQPEIGGGTHNQQLFLTLTRIPLQQLLTKADPGGSWRKSADHPSRVSKKNGVVCGIKMRHLADINKPFPIINLVLDGQTNFQVQGLTHNPVAFTEMPFRCECLY